MVYKIILVSATVFLTGCQTFNAQTYGISPETNYALKSLKFNESIFIGNFSASQALDTNCRAVGPISLPNNLTIQDYIKKAFEDELKVAGVYAHKSPKVILNGKINKINMSSTKSLFRGFWEIDLTITSSNGKSFAVNEYYEFSSGFDGNAACQNTANALMPAVQNLIGKIINSPEFKDLVTE